MSKPEERYLNLRKKQLPNGKQVYAPAIPKTIETTVSDETFIANEIDRMDILSHNVFGTSVDWWKIAAANKKINGSLFFTPGQTVIIPKV